MTGDGAHSVAGLMGVCVCGMETRCNCAHSLAGRLRVALSSPEYSASITTTPHLSPRGSQRPMRSVDWEGAVLVPDPFNSFTLPAICKASVFWVGASIFPVWHGHGS